MLQTAEQRFDQVVELFIKAAKHRYKEASEDGTLTEQMKRWVNLKGDFEPAFNLSRTFSTHFNHHSLMTLVEMVNLFHWIFTHFDTELDRAMAWLNAGTLFFCHTKECEQNHSHPFSRPLATIIEEYIDLEVKRRVKQELRILKIKKMEQELEEKNKNRDQ